MQIDLSLQNATILSIAVTFVILLTIALLTRVVLRVVFRYVDEPTKRYHASRSVRRFASLLALIAIFVIWSPGENLVTILTVIGAGTAIALREMVLSAVGWMNIAVRAPYRQGDRIEINGVQGDVLDIRLLHTAMMEIGGWVEAEQSTGRIVHIPNNWVFLHPIYNYTRGFNFIWNEIGVTVSFRSNWEAAREIMLSLAQESAAIVEQQAAREIRNLSREYLVHYSILTPFVYVSIQPNGVRLTLRYLCEVRKRRGTSHAITMGILEKFRVHGEIEFAHSATASFSHEEPQFGPFPVPEHNNSRPNEARIPRS